jgi:hypothetical protein
MMVVADNSKYNALVERLKALNEIIGNDESLGMALESA